MKKTLSLFLVGVFIISTLAGCSNISTSQNNGPEVVKIGVIAPLSGPAADYGIDLTNAYKYAVDQFNQSNKKYKMDLIIEDGKCSGKDSTSAAQKLINIDKVAFLLGGACSSETITSAEVAKTKNMSVISPTASAGEISRIGNVFRFWSDDLIGGQFGIYVETQVKKLAIITENTDYAVGILNNFKKTFGGSIINDIHFSSNEKDFSMIAKQLDLSKIDGLLFIGQSDESIKSFYESLSKVDGFKTIQGKIFMPYFCSSDNVRTALAEKFDGVTCIDSPIVKDMNQKGKDFIDLYKKQNTISTIESWVVFAKEVIDILGTAISNGNTKPQEIENFLRTYNKDNIRKGYVGNYYFNQSGDAIGLKYVLQKVKSGQVEILK